MSLIIIIFYENYFLVGKDIYFIIYQNHVILFMIFYYKNDIINLRKGRMKMRKRKQKKLKNAMVAMMISGVVIGSGSMMSGCGNNNETVNQNTNKADSQIENLENTEINASQNIGTNTDNNQNNHAITFIDDLGREITVENPQRVAALLGSFADIWYLAGGEIIASADDAWEDFELLLSKDAVNLGMTKDLSLEKVFEANPDLILASMNTKQHLEWKDTLESAKITTAYFDVSDFDDYLRVLKIFTDITGRSDLYKTNGTSIANQIEDIIERSQAKIKETGEAPKILSLRASASYIRAKNSNGNVLGEMLKALGCENIADSEDSLMENLNLEYIIQENPDYIFICQIGDDMEAVKKHMNEFIAENPAWSNLTAVKTGHVYYMEKALYTLKPNERWAEAYEKVEKILFAN